ncbi:MAG: hypothetical protein OEU26_03775, partial [Candidatus Tectomicrobia bacterium]|nr:hypothetical protein [Candidatus Tectomicrobia bacterium]
KRLLIGAEQDLAKEMQDPVLWEALAILIGGGLPHIEAGMEVVSVCSSSISTTMSGESNGSASRKRQRS